MKKDVRREAFREFAVGKGLKSTRQRELILDGFLSSRRHMSVEELHRKLRDRHPGIGYATVSRTLKLFTESGIAREISFGDGQTRYEPLSRGEHHDHMICTSCGAIAEFENKTIEKVQREVAETHRFIIQSHKLELYGLCVKCRK